MAKKVSLKIFISISLICGILSACMSPINIEVFFQDPDVDRIVQASKIAVIVDDKTGDGLVGRDRRIEGLKPDKYYLVAKEIDADGIPVNPTPPYPMYVTEDPTLTQGQLYAELGYITRIKHGRIVPLTNLHTYTVMSAEKFSQDTSFSYSIGAGVPTSISVNDKGVITIPASAETINFVQLDTLYTGYEVMAVAVTPTDLSNTSHFFGNASETINGLKSSFPLEGADTTVDYVFVDKNSDPLVFKVLTVKIDPIVINIPAINGVTPPAYGETAVTKITDTAQYKGTVTWSPALSGGKFAASTVYTATIKLTPESGYTLTGVAANFFTVDGTSSPATNSINAGVITAVFPATGAAPLSEINIPAITGVTVPAIGGTPVTKITDTLQYKGTVTWSPDPDLSGGKFAASTVYTATITLTPESGYTLTGVMANFFTVAGASPVTNSVNAGVITAVFPSTAPASPSGNAGVTINFTIGDKVISGGTASIVIGSINGSDNTKSFNLTDDNGSTTTLSNIKWYHNGTVLPSQTSYTLLLSNSQSNIGYLIVGTHRFTATAEIDGKPYSASFTLTVTEK
jgi:hypothetical protein